MELDSITHVQTTVVGIRPWGNLAISLEGRGAIIWSRLRAQDLSPLNTEGVSGCLLATWMCFYVVLETDEL